MPTFQVDTKAPAARLVRFSTGTLNPNTKDSLQFKCFRRKRKSDTEKPQLVVTTELNGIPFCGRNYGTSNFFQTDSCDYYIAIRKHDSDKMKVIPAHLFQLEPQFAEKESSLEKVNGEKLSYTEQRYELIKQFGSGKMQKSIKKRLKEKLDKSMIAETTESAVKNVKIEAETPKRTKDMVDNQTTPLSSNSGDSAPESSVLPPHDINATVLDDVYKLDDVVPPDIRAELASTAEEFVESTMSDIHTWRTEKKYFEIVLRTLEKGMFKEKEARFQHCQCLMYLHYLLSLYKMKSDDFRRRYPLPQSWNIRLKDHLLQRFTLSVTNSPRRYLPSRIKNLQMSYILVLCLHLNNYQVDLSCLAGDLKMPIKKLQMHAQAIGCKVSSKDQVWTAVLSLPLQFPQVKGKMAKKRIF